MIQNPILPGFTPDPSIIRAGEDYYIATSTFEWWPGVKLFTSKDLKNWYQIPSPLRRDDQIQLKGDPTSGGVWAPCLSYDGEYYYLTYTDVKTKKGRFYNTHNYVIKTKDIYGDWSERVYLNSIGFDPSLFHDTDGQKYLINMINGFKGVTITPLDRDTLQPLESPKLIYRGQIGYTEGPHMYHIGDYYYLIAAEGGCGYNHCVTIARSKELYGPYEPAPKSPILSAKPGEPMANCGHADMVETPEGEWYMVYLCSRPKQEIPGTVLGRETAIQKFIWKDGWPEIEDSFATQNTPSPFLSGGVSEKDCHLEKETYGGNFSDHFDDKKLSLRYSSPRHNYEEFTSLTARGSHVRIYGGESLNSLFDVSLLAVSQRDYQTTVSTTMEFTPHAPEQMAGLAYMYDAMNFYLFVKSVTEDGKECLYLLKSEGGVIEDLIDPVYPEEKGVVRLWAETYDNGSKVRFAYEQNGFKETVLEEVPCGILTDEACRGFTGAHFGLYVHDMTGQRNYADFDEFRMESGK